MFRMLFSTCWCSGCCGQAADITQVAVVIVIVVGFYCRCKYTSSFFLPLFILLRFSCFVRCIRLSHCHLHAIFHRFVGCQRLARCHCRVRTQYKTFHKDFNIFGNILAGCHVLCIEQIFEKLKVRTVWVEFTGKLTVWTSNDKNCSIMFNWDRSLKSKYETVFTAELYSFPSFQPYAQQSILKISFLGSQYRLC